MMLNRILCCGLLMAGCAAYGEEEWVEVYQPLAETKIPCRLMRPWQFDSDQHYPVIVSLHGGGGRGSDNRKQLRNWNRLLAKKQRRIDYPCYVLALQSTELWNDKHLRQIKQVIKQLPAVDVDRIYILGHSMGGHGKYLLTQLDPGYFAAAAPSAGSGLKTTEEFIYPAKIKDLPIWAFHGDNDRVCPIERDEKVFEQMKALGGKMKFTVWKGDGHGVATKMILGGENGTTRMSSDHCDKEPNLMTWLFAQSRKHPQK